MLRKVSGAFVKNIADSNAYRFIRRRPSVRSNCSTMQRWFPVYTLMELLISMGRMRWTADNDVNYDDVDLRRIKQK